MESYDESNVWKLDDHISISKTELESYPHQHDVIVNKLITHYSGLDDLISRYFWDDEDIMTYCTIKKIVIPADLLHHINECKIKSEIVLI